MSSNTVRTWREVAITLLVGSVGVMALFGAIVLMTAVPWLLYVALLGMVGVMLGAMLRMVLTVHFNDRLPSWLRWPFDL